MLARSWRHPTPKALPDQFVVSACFGVLEGLRRYCVVRSVIRFRSHCLSFAGAGSGKSTLPQWQHLRGCLIGLRGRAAISDCVSHAPVAAPARLSAGPRSLGLSMTMSLVQLESLGATAHQDRFVQHELFRLAAACSAPVERHWGAAQDLALTCLW